MNVEREADFQYRHDQAAPSEALTEEMSARSRGAFELAGVDMGNHTSNTRQCKNRCLDSPATSDVHDFIDLQTGGPS